MNSLKPIDYSILFELMRNSKVSDRQLARKMGVSQPTVTRRRARLEKDNLLEYTAIPDFVKLGYGIMAFSFSKWTEKALTREVPQKEISKLINNFLSEHPNVIFGTTFGNGMGMDSACISIHKDYSDYDSFQKDARTAWGKYMNEFQSFVINLNSDSVIRQISLHSFPEYMKKIERLSSTKK